MRLSALQPGGVLFCLLVAVSVWWQGSAFAQTDPPVVGKSAFAGTVIAVVPGSVVHGLGNLYAGNKRTFKTLLVSEAVAVGLLGVAAGLGRADGGDGALGDVAVGVGLLSYAVFLWGWGWDIATTPSSVAAYNYGEEYSERSDPALQVKRAANGFVKYAIRSEHIPEAACMDGTVFAVHGRVGVLSRMDRVERDECQLHVEARRGRFCLAFGFYQDRYRDMAPTAPAWRRIPENSRYRAPQWRGGYSVGSLWKRTIVPYFAGDIVYGGSAEGGIVFPSLDNWGAGVEARGNALSFHVGVKHVGPTRGLGSGEEPPESVTFLTAGIGYQLRLFRTGS